MDAIEFINEKVRMCNQYDLKISTKWGAKCGIPNAQWRGTKG